VSTSARLSILSVLTALGAVAAYVLLFRIAIIRNHSESYVIAFALATAVAALGVRWFSVSRNFQVRPDPGDVLRAVRAL
jgi:hypothetical protein